MADQSSLVHRIRRVARDRPDRTKIEDPGGIGAGLEEVFLPPGHLAKFPQPGKLIEFDDASNELAYTTGRDDTTNMLFIERAADGTTAVAHNNGTTILIEPRFLGLDIMEAVNEVIDLELWPFVWVPGELTLDYQSTSPAFTLPQGGVDEIAYVYQISSGEQYQLGFRHVGPDLAGDSAYPHGFVLLPGAIDLSPIYIAYRSRPTLASLTPSLESLVMLGAMAHLQLSEEAAGTGPDSTVVDRSLQPGSRLRAGAVGLQSFQSARSTLMISLQQAETDRRRHLVRSVS